VLSMHLYLNNYSINKGNELWFKYVSLLFVSSIYEMLENA